MKNKDKRKKILLLLGNLFLIFIMITAVWVYSGYISKSQEESKRKEFIRTIESMKSVSKNYLDGEKGYIKDWSSYISKKNMTMEDALEYLREINTNKERFVHIVDMDTYEAYSSHYPKGKEKIDTYIKYKSREIASELPFGEIMEKMFSQKGDQFQVLGKYRLEETQSMAVGVGTRVTLRTKAGKKDYLMLRIIPVEAIKKSWIFSTEYSSGEVGIITRNCDYVIQSSSMRSQNFAECIRGYNFQNRYNEAEKLRQKIKNRKSGVLEYKNFKGTDCIWYYSSFGKNSALDILGILNKDALKSSADAWYITIIVCATLLILLVADSLYLIGMNRNLREAARLSQQASEAKTQFLSAMSHDIRTPLNAVLGMMNLVKNKADDSQYVLQCIDKGIQSGKHLLTLINDVLDISKIESGNITLRSKPISLVDMMQDLVEMQKQDLAEKKIELESDFNALSHSYVCGDRMRLNQIYVNLFSNAIKYTDSGGKIVLRLWEETIPGDANTIRLIYYIEDNGKGMTKEFQENMYRKFSREISTQINTTQGTGLGLAIVKQMVDLMDGTIVCESLPDVGTKFTVTIDLPIAQEVVTTVSTKEEEQNIGDIRLLVAEDNDLNWEIFSGLLSYQGILCDHAWDGKECVEMLKKAPPGTYMAVLMDIHMPVMNGYEATKEIRSLTEENVRDIPILAMTADAFEEDVQACLDCGMNGHIAKPVEMKVLFSYLEKIQNGQL